MIFNLSSGLTTVRDAAPATPPAMKYEVICGLRNDIMGFFLLSSATATTAALVLSSTGCEGRVRSEACDVIAILYNLEVSSVASM
jgi:hypothetical protein